jgi:hypothetical protein
VKLTWKIALLTTALVVGGSVVGVGIASGDDDPGPLRIRGGATTILEGGTGSPDFTPVLTKLAFYWNGESGDLECLALAPSQPAGDAGSGDFDTNIMYVTGPIASAEVRGATAILRGTATVTGVGAGDGEPFTLTIQRGGPGATAILEVSGLVFREIVLEGRISF